MTVDKPPTKTVAIQSAAEINASKKTSSTKNCVSEKPQTTSVVLDTKQKNPIVNSQNNLSNTKTHTKTAVNTTAIKSPKSVSPNPVPTADTSAMTTTTATTTATANKQNLKIQKPQRSCS